MLNQEFSTDIHSHPTLRAYNTPFPNSNRNIWEKTSNPSYDTPASRWARIQTREILKESQANLYAYAEGGVRVVFDSLYPVEKGFLNFRKIASMMVGKKKGDEILHTVTGLDRYQLDQLRTQKNYFDELQAQYAFLHKGQGPSPDGRFSYQLVGNYHEMENLLQSDPNALAVVVSIEGAHAFNCGISRGIRNRPMYKELAENIGTVKAWEYPPFFITFAHHFYNELCGHTRSFKPPVYTAFNQKRGLNKGINDLGWRILHELLATDNGPRMLIDIKHMSVRSRREYYRFVESYNRINPSDRIPVICSHTGVNEFKTMKGSMRKADKPAKTKSSNYHNWAINISAEEIRFIHSTGGLIGIMLDKGLLASHTMLEQIRKIEDPTERKDALITIIARTIFHIVDVIGDRSAWDTIVLGSDYDGLITHVDLYPTAASIPDFRADLIDFLKRKQYQKDMWYGYEPEELLTKLLRTNTLAFMKDHFYSTKSTSIPALHV